MRVKNNTEMKAAVHSERNAAALLNEFRQGVQASAEDVDGVRPESGAAAYDEDAVGVAGDYLLIGGEIGKAI